MNVFHSSKYIKIPEPRTKIKRDSRRKSKESANRQNIALFFSIFHILTTENVLFLNIIYKTFIDFTMFSSTSQAQLENGIAK